MAEAVVSPWHGQRRHVRSATSGRGCFGRDRHVARRCGDLPSRYQSSGEPESRGITPRNRASLIMKSSCRRRRYRSAASSDSAATQCTSGRAPLNGDIVVKLEVAVDPAGETGRRSDRAESVTQ